MTIELPDPKHADMSPEAIFERLKMVEALRRLGLALKEAGERGPIETHQILPVADDAGRPLADTLGRQLRRLDQEKTR